jgi:hypothetical protein
MILCEKPWCWFLVLGSLFPVSIWVYGLDSGEYEHLRSDALPDTTMIRQESSHGPSRLKDPMPYPLYTQQYKPQNYVNILTQGFPTSGPILCGPRPVWENRVVAKTIFTPTSITFLICTIIRNALHLVTVFWNSPTIAFEWAPINKIPTCRDENTARPLWMFDLWRGCGPPGTLQYVDAAPSMKSLGTPVLCDAYQPLSHTLYWGYDVIRMINDMESNLYNYNQTTLIIGKTGLSVAKQLEPKTLSPSP